MKPWGQGWLIAAGAYPGFGSMKRLEVFLLPGVERINHEASASPIKINNQSLHFSLMYFTSFYFTRSNGNCCVRRGIII